MGKGEDSVSSQEIFPSKPIAIQQKEIYQALENFKTQVNKDDYHEFVNVPLKVYLASRAKNFKAGQLSNCYEEWKQITSDEDILATISGEKIEFMGHPPVQHSTPYSNALQQDQLCLVEQEIKSLLEKEVIVKCEPEEIEFVSPIFTVPKKDGKLRLILNLKKLNTSVKYAHFKMDSIHTILKLITKDCWMASIDLKDAYYSVRIHPEHQRFLKFTYKGQLYKFTVFPNGLSSCPRRFTKIMKPLLAKIRLLLHIISGYLDDLYLQNNNYEGCVRAIIDTLLILEKYGFTIHPDKSVLIPSQTIIVLGFVINSKDMTITLTTQKIAVLKSLIERILHSPDKVKIREVAKILGHLVSSLPAVMFGGLYYRCLDKDKTCALKVSNGNFEATMSISQQGIQELTWWLDNLEGSYNVIQHPPIDIVLYSDASTTGWGAALGEQSTGGHWSPAEAELHINGLELKAALFALQSFKHHLNGKHVKLMIDNTTAVYIINNMGTSHSDHCHSVCVAIWEFCISHKIWLTAAHLPGSLNVVADKESRQSYRDSEWMIDSHILQESLLHLNFKPEIDLFASRLNK